MRIVRCHEACHEHAGTYDDYNAPQIWSWELSEYERICFIDNGMRSYLIYCTNKSVQQAGEFKLGVYPCCHPTEVWDAISDTVFKHIGVICAPIQSDMETLSLPPQFQDVAQWMH